MQLSLHCKGQKFQAVRLSLWLFMHIFAFLFQLLFEVVECYFSINKTETKVRESYQSLAFSHEISHLRKHVCIVLSVIKFNLTSIVFLLLYTYSFFYFENIISTKKEQNKTEFIWCMLVKSSICWVLCCIAISTVDLLNLGFVTYSPQPQVQHTYMANCHLKTYKDTKTS